MTRPTAACVRLLLALAVMPFGCTGKRATDPKPSALQLFDDSGHLLAILAADDRILDATGPVGRVVWKTPEVVIGPYREALAFDIDDQGITLATTMGDLHVVVDQTSVLTVNGTRVGRLVGFVRTKDDWRRIAALVVALPLLPTRRTPVDAAPEIAEPPPPPPPPPPPAPASRQR